MRLGQNVSVLRQGAFFVEKMETLSITYKHANAPLRVGKSDPSLGRLGPDYKRNVQAGPPPSREPAKPPDRAHSPASISRTCASFRRWTGLRQAVKENGENEDLTYQPRRRGRRKFLGTWYLFRNLCGSDPSGTPRPVASPSLCTCSSGI